MKPLALLHIVFVICACLVACNDDDPITPNNSNTQEQLPPITTIGAGTFGCKVNGKVWVAKSNKTGWPSTYASVDKSNDNLVHILGMILLNNSTDQAIHVYFNTEKKTIYPIYLRKDGNRSGGFNDGNNNQEWSTDSVTGGETTILKYDTITQILSGTFYFDCINKETNDTMHITDGRFDMHYTY